MTNKERIIKIKENKNLTNVQMASYLGCGAWVVANWVRKDRPTCSPSDEQINTLLKHIDSAQERSNWKGKKGIDCIIANMYALEKM